MPYDRAMSGAVREDSPRYDVIIVGAGPAGATCAWFTACSGLRVLLLDHARFPRDKACGDALSRTKALPILREMGLASRLDGLPGAWCTALRIMDSANHDLTLTLSSAGTGDAAHLVCPRTVFDAWLLEQVRTRVDVWEQTACVGLLKDGAGRVTGVLAQRHGAGETMPITARVVVGADGAHSIVARQAGLQAGDPRELGIAVRGYVQGWDGPDDRLEFYYLDDALPGCLWVFPLGHGRANVGLGLLKRDVPRHGMGLTELFWTLIDRHPVLKARFAGMRLDGSMRGWPLPGWSARRRLSAAGVLLAGDAAWLVDPVTGEGIGNAMVSGREAAAAITEALQRGEASACALRAYDARIARALGRDLRMKLMMQYLLRQPVIVHGVLALARSHGAIRRLLEAVISTPYTDRREAWSVRGLLRLLAARSMPGAA